MIGLLQRSLLTLSVLFCSAGSLPAQTRYYDMWYFGGRHSLDFRGTPVSPSSGSLEALEGCSSICDPNTGAILFYTNGATIWNSRNQVMQNGNNLFGNLSCTQSSLIVPAPGNPSLFYVFTMDGTTVGGPRNPQGLGLCYSIVDMRLDGGLGGVVTKNVTLLRSASEKVTAVRHRYGCGFWIITHELRNDKFYAWLLTEQGLRSRPVVSSAGRSYNATEAGYLKASPDGSLLFTAQSFISYNGNSGELFRFDNGTGVVGPRVAVLPSGYGASFSPDNNFLYASREDSLLQYDLRAAPGQIAATARLVNVPEAGRMFYGMQIAPNGKVFTVEGPVFTSFTPSLMKIGAINNPDAPGTTAAYSVQFNYPSVSFFAGLPNCIDAYLGVSSISPGSGTQHTASAEDTVICAGGAAQLHASGGVSYRWFPSEGLDCDTCPDPVARPLETTTYLVEIYDDRSCLLFDTLRVTIRVTDYNADAGPDTAICFGGSTRLQASGGSFYEWTPSEGLSCTDCPDPEASPDRTMTYHVKITHENGCVITDSVRITVHDGSPVRISPRDTTVNCGESLTLRAPGGKEYRWSPTEAFDCADCPEPVVTPAGTTTYYLSVLDSLGCTGLDSITVHVAERKVSAGADTAVCAGSGVPLSAKGKKEYLWRPAEGLSCTDCANPTATPEKTTTYIVEGRTNGLCLSFDTVVVTVLDLPAADAGADRRICLGDSLQLKGTGGIAYSWTPAINLTCLNCPDPVAFPRESVTYYLQVTGENGCVARDSVRVTVQRSGSVAASGDAAFCPGGTAQLSASGAESYRWSPAEGLSCTDCANPTATPEKTTTYYVIGTNAFGECPALDSVTVTIHDLPVIDAGVGAALCGGESVQLNASGGVRYRWDPSSDLSCLDCADPIATPTKTTTYYVTGTNAEGCESRDSVRVQVHPEPVVDAGADHAICIEESIRLSASGGERWLWEPAEGLSCTDCADPTATPEKTTTYYVTAWNAEGCSALDSATVVVQDQPQVIRLRIGRNYHGKTDEMIMLSVETIEPIGETGIAELELALEYDPTAMLMDESSLARLLSGTILEGWKMEILRRETGRIVLRFTAPPGETLKGGGDLLRFEGRMYLSGRRGTELPFTVSTSSRCFVFETEAGYAQVDSICGLNFRLIELTSEKYAVPTAYPNPARDRMRFEFGLGLDGATRLEVFDVRGNRVGVLLEETLAPGRYGVEWDVRDVPSGVYWYRLTSGDWSGGGEVRVAR